MNAQHDDTTSIQRIDDSAVARNQASALDYFGRERINAIRHVIAKDAGDAEFTLFLEFCRSRGLDPFTRQVYWTREGNIVGIDGLRSIAERTGDYFPGATDYIHDGEGKFIAADVTVHRFIHGEWRDLTERAYLAEYFRAGKKDYKGVYKPSLWETKPTVMTAKVAEARALRRCFPSVMSKIYTPEELVDMADEEATAQPPAPKRRREFQRARNTGKESVIEAIVEDTSATEPAPVVTDDDSQPRAEERAERKGGAMIDFIVAYASRLKSCAEFDDLLEMTREMADEKTRVLGKGTKAMFAVEAFEDRLSCELSGTAWQPQEKKELAVKWIESLLAA